MREGTASAWSENVNEFVSFSYACMCSCFYIWACIYMDACVYHVQVREGIASAWSENANEFMPCRYAKSSACVYIPHVHKNAACHV